MLINSRENSKIKAIKKLKQKKYRKQTATYMAYNENIIYEAKKSNLLEVVITTEEEYDFENVIYVTDDIMQYLCDLKPLPCVIGVCKINKSVEFSNPKVLVLDEIQDPGNMGTILRTALAFGFGDVFIGNGCVDIYNDKVVTSAQGVLTHLNFIHGDVVEYLSNDNREIVTTFLDEDTTYETSSSFNLVIGNEGRGINPEIKKLQHLNYKLDIEFESLNVSVATGIVINNLR